MWNAKLKIKYLVLILINQGADINVLYYLIRENVKYLIVFYGSSRLQWRHDFTEFFCTSVYIFLESTVRSWFDLRDDVLYALDESRDRCPLDRVVGIRGCHSLEVALGVAVGCYPRCTGRARRRRRCRLLVVQTIRDFDDKNVFFKENSAKNLVEFHEYFCWQWGPLFSAPYFLSPP